MPKKYLFLTLGIIFSLIFSTILVYTIAVDNSVFPVIIRLLLFLSILPLQFLFLKSGDIRIFPEMFAIYLTNLGYVFLIYWIFVSKKKAIPIIAIGIALLIVVGTLLNWILAWE